MQLLVRNRLDPSRATEIFSVTKRRFFASALYRKLHATEIKVDYSAVHIRCIMRFVDH